MSHSSPPPAESSSPSVSSAAAGGGGGGRAPAISVALTCRNNAATIGRLLGSLVHLGEGVEVVALDNGSTDETVEILEGHGARVVRGEWRGHIRTKQEVMDLCRGAWVLNLDSDESVEAGLGRAIVAAVAGADAGVGGKGGVAGFRINRQTWYRGRPLRYAWQPDRIVRLVRRGRVRFEGVEPHPRMEVVPGDGGRIEDLGGGDGENLRHDSFETFAEHLARQAEYARLGAAAARSAGKEGSYWRLVTSPVGAFIKQLVVKRGILDGYGGWLAAGSTAAGALMKHMILIEMSRGEGVGR